MNNRHRWLFWLTVVLVFFLFASAFILSYDALYRLAVRNGITPRLAWLWPLGLDAFMAASSLAVVWASLNQTRVMWFRLLVGLSVCLSIAGNVLHAEPVILARAVAALPPAVAFLSFEVLMVMVRHETERAGLRSALDQLQAARDQLSADVNQARADLKSARDRTRASRERVKALDEQAIELRQTVAELQEFGGDTKAVRQERLRALLASSNGDRPTVRELARQLDVSESTIKRDLQEIEP